MSRRATGLNAKEQAFIAAMVGRTEKVVFATTFRIARICLAEYSSEEGTVFEKRQRVHNMTRDLLRSGAETILETIITEMEKAGISQGKRAALKRIK